MNAIMSFPLADLGLAVYDIFMDVLSTIKVLYLICILQHEQK